MKYTVRLNPKAVNPLTHKIDVSRIWEVEQCADRDSERIKWHCAEVQINDMPINKFFYTTKPGEPAWEFTTYGIAVRGQDNAIVIRTGKHDASGH